MATVFLGYRRTAYDRLSASWKDNYWSVYRRTNIQVTRCDQAKSDESCHLGVDCFITMHQRTSHWLQAVCNCEFVQLNHPAYQWRINHDANDAMAWGPPLKGAPRAAV